MAEISARDKQLEWTCRILITVNVYFVISGYISFFQTKRQLISPLIPRSTLYEISDMYMQASLALSAGLLAGLWLYFFGKKIAAIVVLCLGPLLYEIFLWVFRK